MGSREQAMSHIGKYYDLWHKNIETVINQVQQAVEAADQIIEMKEECGSGFVDHTIRQLLREPGHPLDPATRSIMERSLCCDFGDVVVHTSNLSDRVNRALGTLAFTIDQHLCFSSHAYRPDSEFGRLVLAHELTHVVQQRLGKNGNRRASRAERVAAEIEADAAAWTVLHGRAYACSTPLPSGTLAAWGPAGHYYTVYYVLLAAGLEDGNACRTAFFAQMPDQVDELDALSQGKRHGKKAVKDIIRVHATGEFDQGKFDASREYTRDIQLGLHCLTARSSGKETGARRQVILNTKFESEIGLAFHAFGDSFAHRKLGDERVMYASPIGHLPDGHKADEIHKRPALYRNYVLHMFNLASEKWPAATRRIVDPAKLSANADRVIAETTEDAQIEALTKLSAEIGCKLNSYNPNKEAKRSFDEFIKIHAVNAAFLGRCLELARSWSWASANYNGPEAADLTSAPIPANAPQSIHDVFKGMPTR